MRRPMCKGKIARRNAKGDEQDPEQEACENEKDESGSNRHEDSKRWQATCDLGLVCVRVCRRMEREMVRTQDGVMLFTNIAGNRIQQEKQVHQDTRFDSNTDIPVDFDTTTVL